MQRQTVNRIADCETLNSIPGQAPGFELLSVLRPYVRHCGDSHRKAWSIGPRRLLDYLVVYIAEGHGRFSVGDRTWDAAPNDLFWIPPDTLHSMEGFAPEMHCPYVHFDVDFRPSHGFWDFSIPEGMTDLGELRPLMHPPVTDARLSRLKGRIRGHTNRAAGLLLQDVCAEAARAQPYSALRMSALMMMVITEVLRGMEGLPVESLGWIPSLECAAERLHRECGAPPSLTEVARRSGLSPSHFRMLFQQHYGCCPRTYLRRARLRKACELMVTTSLSLSEIALKVGFGTIHSFSRAFRQEEGLSPRDYRRCGPLRTRVEGRRTPYVQ